MRVFGLTGGIASGKSCVAKVFAREGVAVVDADQVAREVVAKGQPAFTELLEAFGDGILAADGELDRKALAKVAFATAKNRAKLNAITHPKIGLATQLRFQDLGKEGAELICYDASLLVENHMENAFKPLVVVSAPVDLQIERAKARDAATADEVIVRIRAQLPIEEKVAVADYVIENVGTLAELEAKALEVLAKVRTWGT